MHAPLMHAAARFLHPDLYAVAVVPFAADATPDPLGALSQVGVVGSIAAMAIGALAWIIRRSLAEKDELRMENRDLHKSIADGHKEMLPVLMAAARAIEQNNEAQRDLTTLGTRLVQAAADLEAAVRHRRD